jgi:hypothetical protein
MGQESIMPSMYNPSSFCKVYSFSPFTMQMERRFKSPDKSLYFGKCHDEIDLRSLHHGRKEFEEILLNLVIKYLSSNE